MKPSTSLIGLAIVAFVGALLVPVALGVTRPDDRAGPLGVGAAVAATDVVRPDDRAGPLGVGAAVVATQATHPNDAGGALGVGAVALEKPAFWRGERDYGLYTPAGDVAAPAVVPVAVAEPSGWDWGDFVVPVAVVALVALLVGGIATATGHGPHRPHRPVAH